VTSSDAVLAILAKAPLPGLVKTRMCPPLRPEQAAELYAAMLLDILAQHDVEPDVDVTLWYAPDDALDWFRAHVPPRFALRAQQGPDLARRMTALVRAHAEQGYTRMVLRGTDSPTLPPSRIGEAFEALHRCDVVLCPDTDGGYNLIGVRKPSDALFELEMSTASVLDATLRKARELGLRVELLEPHHDVDTAADLPLLARELSPDRTPRTRDWLERHAAEVKG